jgi:O-antigen/teichoic acid export membrane protein
MKKRIENIYKKHAVNIKRGVLLILIYSIVKSLVYFAPLSISYIVHNVAQYGEFEYSLSLGQTLSGIFSMGFPSAYAYFILKNENVRLRPLFHFHFLLLTALVLLVVLIFPSLINNLYFGSVVIGLSIANQLLAATVYKLEGKNIMAVFADSWIYFIMAAFAVLIYFEIFSYSNAYWHSAIILFLIVFNLSYHLRKSKGVFQLNKQEVVGVYKYGILIIIAAPLLYLLSNNTRLFIGYLMTYDDVGIYSFYFRLASFIIIFHRVIGILFFRKIFLSRHETIDKYYAIFTVFMFLVNVALFFIIPVILHGRYKLFDDTFTANKTLFLIAIFQVSFWLSLSLFESLMHREYLTRQFIVSLVISIGLFIGTLFLISRTGQISLPVIVAVNSGFMLLGNLLQMGILYRKGFKYKKTFSVQIVIGVIFILTILIYK